MAYTKVDSTLQENGVPVDILSDGTLFVRVRSARSKAVEKERQKRQQPYRNIIMSGRALPPGIAAQIGRAVCANAIIAGIAGAIGEHSFGKIEGEGDEAKPVEWAHPEPEALEAILLDFPDFEEDVSTAAMASITFERVNKVVDAEGEAPPSDAETAELAGGN